MDEIHFAKINKGAYLRVTISRIWQSLGTAKRLAGGEAFIPQFGPRTEENGKLLIS